MFQDEKDLYRGSKWRKWDLQLHCPDDVLNNQFIGKTAEEKWENYVTALEQTDLEAIAITNYFCINGYEKLLQYKEKGRLSNLKFIIPNIEFRLSQPNQKGECINIHVIFNNGNEIITRIDNFLNRLKLINTDESGKALYCSLQDIKQVGYDKALVDFNELICEIENNFIHLKDYMIIGVARGYGSFRPASDDGRGATLAIEIDKKSDLFFGNSNEIKFYNDISRFQGAKQKPIVRTSDAHELGRIGLDYSLIKADCTFDGLRQILYEPLHRIKLQDEIPRYLYPQILSLKLLNNEKYEPKKNEFPPITLTGEVYFSPNLTSVIGSRASGKTVLVELIGFVSDTFTTAVKDNKPFLVEYLSQNFDNLEIELSIQSGSEGFEKYSRPVKDWKNPLYGSPIKVEYWAQGDIEKRANNAEEIAEYINDRLQSDVLLKAKEEINRIKEEMIKLRNNYSNKPQIEIEKKQFETERKQIESYFRKLETKEYKVITKNIEDNRKKRQVIDGLIKDINNQIYIIKNLMRQLKHNRTVEKLDAISLFKNSSSLNNRIKWYYEFEDRNLGEVTMELQKISDEIKKSNIKIELGKNNNKLTEEFMIYCKENGIKVTNEEIEKRNERIEYLNQQIFAFDNKLRSLEDDRKQHDQLSIQLKESIHSWEEENNTLIEDFNNMISGSEISAKWDNPKNQIKNWIKEQISQANSELKGMIEDNYKKKSPLKDNNLEEILEEIFITYGDATLNVLVSLLNSNNAPKIEKGSGKIETIKWLFEDIETIPLREDIIMRINEFSKVGSTLILCGGKILGKDSMSFGERCGSLIELILLSGDHPLIIDQPEDHLDAKFIADKIVKLIREQKVNRQIIICTHNANIVVLGDSELVNSMSVNTEDELEIKQGSLENKDMRKIIFDVLEGGATAFKKREQKYSEIIT